jgi:nucleoid-associated protein YgaU
MEREMKRNLILIFLLSVFISSVFAQEVKMKYEDWQKEMASWTAKRDELRVKLDALNKDVDALKKQLADKDAQIKRTQDEIYALVGTTPEGVNEYRQKVADFERRLNELSRLSNEQLYERKAEVEKLYNDYQALKSDKRVALSEFYDKVMGFESQVNNLNNTVKALVKTREGKVILAEAIVKETTYTVGTWKKDRDCLWNIAKKPTIYDNPFLWPKIWIANREKIKDPDLIYPGWVLKVPPKAELTKEEKRAANSYYRKKAEKAGGGM